LHLKIVYESIQGDRVKMGVSIQQRQVQIIASRQPFASGSTNLTAAVLGNIKPPTMLILF